MANNKKKKTAKQNKKDKPKVEQTKSSTKEKKANAKSMSEKTEVKVKTEQKSNKSRTMKIVGALGALLLLLLIFVGLAVFLFFRVKPRVNGDLPIPVLENLPEYTSEEKITVEGSVDDADKVLVFVNDVVMGEKSEVKDGKFSYEYEFEEEGDYTFEAAVFKGGFFNVRGENSETETVIYDSTPPSTDVKFEYPEETNLGKITVKGKTEDRVTVVLKKGGASYSTTSDDKGNFEIKDIELMEGENKFTVVLEDRAGNQVQLDDQLKVQYSPGADLNGPGVADEDEPVEDDERDEVKADEDDEGAEEAEEGKGEVVDPDLPESAGELGDAMEILRNQGLMFVIGIMALIAFLLSSGAVALKYTREK